MLIHHSPLAVQWLIHQTWSIKLLCVFSHISLDHQIAPETPADLVVEQIVCGATVTLPWLKATAQANFCCLVDGFHQGTVEVTHISLSVHPSLYLWHTCNKRLNFPSYRITFFCVCTSQSTRVMTLLCIRKNEYGWSNYCLSLREMSSFQRMNYQGWFLYCNCMYGLVHHSQAKGLSPQWGTADWN